MPGDTHVGERTGRHVHSRTTNNIRATDERKVLHRRRCVAEIHTTHKRVSHLAAAYRRRVASRADDRHRLVDDKRTVEIIRTRRDMHRARLVSPLIHRRERVRHRSSRLIRRIVRERVRPLGRHIGLDRLHVHGVSHREFDRLSARRDDKLHRVGTGGERAKRRRRRGVGNRSAVHKPLVGHIIRSAFDLCGHCRLRAKLPVRLADGDAAREFRRRRTLVGADIISRTLRTLHAREVIRHGRDRLASAQGQRPNAEAEVAVRRVHERGIADDIVRAAFDRDVRQVVVEGAVRHQHTAVAVDDVILGRATRHVEATNAACIAR